MGTSCYILIVPHFSSSRGLLVSKRHAKRPYAGFASCAPHPISMSFLKHLDCAAESPGNPSLFPWSPMVPLDFPIGENFPSSPSSLVRILAMQARIRQGQRWFARRSSRRKTAAGDPNGPAVDLLHRDERRA
ncbi:uncharacterized protein LDX57_006260 [Aspergillus melleus]|uniref:uncharacterized protein n=1 Tax=Aspergillus melleus TaxID=138277 RepID=UPI001E8CB5C2|nr:uncharacterized protein LDX57_006260 [Aspergillus melleus]KAH8428564.1 hypothetical protein LDX57_006260 [Aspergillus melleus]